jgi:hypothetical protein
MISLTSWSTRLLSRLTLASLVFSRVVTRLLVPHRGRLTPFVVDCPDWRGTTWHAALGEVTPVARRFVEEGAGSDELHQRAPRM